MATLMDTVIKKRLIVRLPYLPYHAPTHEPEGSSSWEVMQWRHFNVVVETA